MANCVHNLRLWENKRPFTGDIRQMAADGFPVSSAVMTMSFSCIIIDCRVIYKT